MSPTFLAFAEETLVERAKYIRGVDKERNRWDVHVSIVPFSAKPLDQIKAIDIVAWLRLMAEKRAQDRRTPRLLSRATIERSYALVSVIFAEALTAGHIEHNPCVGVRQKKRADEAATKQVWSFLTLEEQSAIKSCSEIPEEDRDAIMFAYGTGLRQGEQFNLQVEDVHVDGIEPFVFVRFGSPGKPPKSGKCRRVPLMGDALDAARRQLVRVSQGLLFPSKSGGVRSVGKPLGRGVKIAGQWVDPFHIHLAAAGVKKIRWHDLRHTCASSLIIGCWGRVWALAEIRDMLGHSSVTITERYAHLGEDALKTAARATFVAQGPAQIRKYGRESGLIRKAIDRAAGVRRTLKSIIEEARHVA